MKKIHLSANIKAPREKVWRVMLDDATYREWTSAFMPGSYYKGSWEEGSKILFLGPNQEGEGEGGMVSRIKENRKYEFISIEHLGIVKNGVEDTVSDEAKKWAPAYENYTFTEMGDTTKLSIVMDIEDEHKTIFEEMWTKALKNIKDIAIR